MLKAARYIRTSPLRRFFQEFQFGEGSGLHTQEPKPHEVVRALPVLRHPIFPKHASRFRLSPELFRFLTADPHSDQVGAFVMKPKEESYEIESMALHSILPLESLDSVYSVGSVCKTSFNKFDRTITLQPLNRVTYTEVLEEPSKEVPFPLVRLKHFEEGGKATSEDEQAFMKLLVEKLEELKNHFSNQEVATLEIIGQRFNMRYDEEFLNYVGTMLSYMCETKKVQHVFEAGSFYERLKRTTELVDEHLQMRSAMRDLQEEAQSKISKASEEHMYREILNLIKNRLGMDRDEKETLRVKYENNLEGKEVPEHIKKLIQEEMERLMMTEKQSGEFHIIRTYLDWLTSLPYGLFTEETFDLSKAKEILDRDHYGMKDVKERILEFLAVSKLRGHSKGKILCFSGPPGVGKTSIARSIAEALNRKYFRISLGGLEDVSELKGHRRTYIGAQPGKLISALKNAGSENPVILIDEIDKMGRRAFQGSPENALLEILDPSQNNSFLDHYLDTTVDLSKVLFITTANFPEEISPILIDRMDLINVQGYTADEKMAILNKHLLPEAVKNTSLEEKTHNFEISHEAKHALIQNYAREAGVRGIQKKINRILEKVARRIVEGESQVIKITPDNLAEYAGQPEFSTHKLYQKMPAGVVMGLAYTSMGGSALYIEVSKSKFAGQESEPKLTMTGNLKQVMSESIQIAYTFARKFASGKGNTFLDNNSIHIHVPEGATPKDGPSAGITITTALLSLALETPVLPDLAMTGEISLTGKVLPIGGLKEKLVAAKREGVKKVILPKQNIHHWKELSESLTKGLEVEFVEEYPEVFSIAFNK